MQERHHNRKLYFEEQAITTEKYVIPYLEKQVCVNAQSRILEIGCGEGGNLKPFVDRGCSCVGIDLSQEQINNAKTFFAQHPNHDKVTFINQDIFLIDQDDFLFDIIFLRDVIEHIHDQERFMSFVKKFLKKDGLIFFAFPPWQMPFGGHQQVCQSKAAKMPYIHLLPKKIYGWILKKSGVPPLGIDMMFEIKDTGISIERFERIIKKEAYKILQKDFYFINPNYEIKFNLKPRKSLPIIRNIPFLRNFYITAAYYLLSLN